MIYDTGVCYPQMAWRGKHPNRVRGHDQVVDLDVILGQQGGVIARRQVLACGEKPHDIRRKVRRHEWASVHPGVYVTHTGALTWHQRAWAAVLASGPDAALCLDSALRAHEAKAVALVDDHGPIHIAVARHRNLDAPQGVRVLRMADLHGRVQWNLSPPRTRYDDTVLDLAARGTALTSVARLADACGSRRTTAARLRDRLDSRPRIAQRTWLRSVLSDVAEGTCSVLEHGYLDLVERAHGLPVGRRQAPRAGSTGRVYRDVDYAGLGLVVELDGRLFHTSTADRDRDLDRDLDAAAARVALTVRLGFGQVYERPCVTAAKVAAVMQRLGWSGSPVACPDC